MDALTALHSRNSVNLLTEPSPNQNQLDNILKAGVRACDHGRLRPWEFLVIEKQARNTLGEMMLSIQLQDNPSLDKASQEKLLQKPLRAPVIIAVIAKIKDNLKINELEQSLSAAAAAQMMMVAAHAQGLGAIWRTGSLAHDARLVKKLGYDKQDKIIGFIYIGTPKTVKPLTPMNPTDYTRFLND